ncbi:MAG: O-antigen ligase family protein, partial [bacterium]
MRIAKLLLILTIISIPLGQLGKIPGLPEGFNLYLVDLLLAVTVGWWLVYSLLVRKSLRLTKVGIAILVFAFVATVSLLWGVPQLESTTEVIISASYLARWVVYAGLYFVTASFPRKDRQDFFNWLIASGVLLALAGFVQLLFFPDWSQFTYLGWDPHKNRLLSTFFDPNFTGIYLVLVINLLFKTFFDRSPRATTEGRPYTALLICVVALVLTFSRSAWLAMAVSIFIWGLLKSRRLLLGAVVLAFLAYFAVPRIQTRIAGGFDPDDSARLRFQSWGQTWDVAKDNLFLGVGFNTFRYAQAERGVFDWRQPQGGHSGAGSDSSLLFVLATTGVFGLAAYLAIFTLALQKNT